jgi:hypothetical protein
MSNATLGAVNLALSDGRRSDRQEVRGGPRSVPSDAEHTGDESLESLLRPEEKELVRQLIQDLRSIRFGSIVLVMHEGRLVEVSKTIRVRKSPQSASEKESEDKR